MSVFVWISLGVVSASGFALNMYRSGKSTNPDDRFAYWLSALFGAALASACFFHAGAAT